MTYGKCELRVLSAIYFGSQECTKTSYFVSILVTITVADLTKQSCINAINLVVHWAIKTFNGGTILKFSIIAASKLVVESHKIRLK